MAGKIRVTPEQLYAQSNKVGQQKCEYTNLYHRFYDEAAKMKAIWKGEANQKYCQQLEGFRSDFQRLDQLLQQYSDYLKKTADEYRKTESNLVTEAGRLSVGR